jgi:tetratricopeptide (TPR) repeat protein
VEDVKGHALTLTLIGSYLHDAHAGDIRKRNLVKLEDADAEIEVIPDHPNHAFHVMDAYARWFETSGKNEEETKKGLRALALLRLLGLFDRPATVGCLTTLWTGEPIANLTEPLVGLNDAQRNIALTKLENARLLTVNRDAAGVLVSLDAHPLLREYFSRQLRTRHPDAWREAHRRLYEHLCKTESDKKPNPTLEDLQPLYQAVAHGCSAGLYRRALDEVFRPRIRRQYTPEKGYSLRKLGAFGMDLSALAGFFETPREKRLGRLRRRDRAYVLSEAGFALRGQGRLGEAVRLLGTGRDEWARLKDAESLKSAARFAQYHSEALQVLGRLTEAEVAARQSVKLSKGSDYQVHSLARCADILHQLGHVDEAGRVFVEAEILQGRLKPQYSLLHEGSGYPYCEFLLSQASRLPGLQRSSMVDQIVERAQTTCAYLTDLSPSLWERASEHLSVGRALTAKCEIERDTKKQPTGFGSDTEAGAHEYLDKAVKELREWGSLLHLPLGLLARADFYRFTRDFPAARADLDEAWEIAERGPMRLFMADIHLHRVRFFYSQKSYPWKSPEADLAAAEKLINECGYHRRDEELVDAWEAAKSW